MRSKIDLRELRKSSIASSPTAAACTQRRGNEGRKQEFMASRAHDHRAPDQRNAGPGVSPNFLRKIASGQNPVNADCKRLSPTKPVSKNQ